MSDYPETAAPPRTCPDGGACHHWCDIGRPCFRVLCCGPLSGVYPGDAWPQDVREIALELDGSGPSTRECARCHRTLVDEDEQGWYYQTPVTDPSAPGLTFMDRVHGCDGQPHDVTLPAAPQGGVTR